MREGIRHLVQDLIRLARFEFLHLQSRLMIKELGILFIMFFMRVSIPLAINFLSSYALSNSFITL